MAPEPPTGVRKPRIGVLMPAGRLEGNLGVVTHTYNAPEKAKTLFTNIGDCFVYDSSLRILDYSELFSDLCALTRQFFENPKPHNQLLDLPSFVETNQNPHQRSMGPDHSGS